MNWYTTLVFLLAILLFNNCQQPIPAIIEKNPPAEGFDAAHSDEKAVHIADQVMEAQGGRHNWDNTKYIKWNFFGSRLHIWNKHTHDYIIKGIRDTFVIKGNLKTGATHLTLKGVQHTEPDSLTKYGEKAKSMWINDSYWLVMPFKLKDSGVKLGYKGIDATMAGDPAHRITMTFKEVGDTPDNMYHVLVDTSTMLVNQWDFYTTTEDTIPRFQLPWTEYKKHGEILLSSGRGDKYEITEIAVGDSLDTYFTKSLKEI